MPSSSFVPAEGEPGASEMIEDLETTFRTYQEDGCVAFGYETRLYYGRPA